MNILVDENIMKEVADLFRSLGFDVKYINSIKKGIPDNEVMDIALQEKRILITSDKEFCKRFKDINHHGVIYLNTSHKYQIDTLKKFIPRMKSMDFSNNVATITKDKCEFREKRKSYLDFRTKTISLE